jgi:2-polyprenyl-6-methoxyphenol hydroxylase-like FAD-dependent oxidoreductase
MNLKAIIIGGGIGGLTAALALRSVGAEATIYERAGELRELGAGLTLWDNAVRALAQIGIGDLLGPIGAPDRPASFRSPSGNLLSTMSGPIGLAVVLHRAELHAALRGRLGPGQLQLGRALSSFAQDDAGITARFADGGSARADILIGADGIGSRVRAQLHGERPARYAGYTAWRAVVPFEHARVLPGETWGGGMRFGQVPLRNGQVYWFATKSLPAGQRSPGGERAALLADFTSWHAPIAELIAAAGEEQILRHDIYDRPPLASWGAGRATLLGDAAHPMTPNLGQGACQAIEDAAVLARCLSEAADPQAALRRYEALRIPRTSAIVRRSRLIGAVGQWRSPLAVSLRAMLLRAVPAEAQARQIQQIVSYAF